MPDLSVASRRRSSRVLDSTFRMPRKGLKAGARMVTPAAPAGHRYDLCLKRALNVAKSGRKDTPHRHTQHLYHRYACRPKYKGNEYANKPKHYRRTIRINPLDNNLQYFLPSHHLPLPPPVSSSPPSSPAASL